MEDYYKTNKEAWNARTKIHLTRYLESRKDNNEALFVSLLKPYSRLKISGVEIRLRELGRKLDIIFDFYKNISERTSKIFDYNVIKCLDNYRKNLMRNLDLFSESNLILSNKIIYSVKENSCMSKFEIIDEGGKNE